MSKCTVIDAFPAFLDFWESVGTVSPDERVELWASEYMSQWPDLLRKQQQSYTEDNEDWRAIAGKRILPFIDDRLPAMKIAHGHLLELSEPTFQRAMAALRCEADIVFVAYVGIGCGVGWADSYDGHPAVFFGLEMIAECGWCEPPSLTGLIAHEIGHVVQHVMRSQRGRENGSGPWWQLFTEGFAQRCEHLVLREDSWHQARGVNEADWIDWCRSRKGWLASEFIRRVDSEESTRSFFGSWFDIQGRKQCGYYLGHEVIKELQSDRDILDIALMDDFEEQSRSILRRYIEEGS